MHILTRAVYRQKCTLDMSKLVFILYLYQCVVENCKLIICDVRNMSADTLHILTNSEVIAVNQDKLGIQGKKVNISGTSEVWAGKLYSESGSAYAVILLNRGSTTASITGQWSDIGISATQSCDVRFVGPQRHGEDDWEGHCHGPKSWGGHVQAHLQLISN